MSLGFGVGDFLAISKLARSIWVQFQESPDQFNAISNEVAGLHLILDDLARNLSGRQISEKQRRDLSTLKEGSWSVLKELGLELENFPSLGEEQPTIGAKTRKAWKKLRRDQDASKEFRSRIVSNTLLLNTINSSLTSEASETMIEGLATLDEQVEVLQLNTDQHERLKLLDWITSLNFPAQ